MEQRLIDKMIAEKRVHLNLEQMFWHYFSVCIIMLIPCFNIYTLIEVYVTKTYQGDFSVSGMINLIVSFSVLGLFIFLVKQRRLKFSQYILHCSESDFNEALRRTVNELNWKIETQKDQFFQAIHPFSWFVSDGELVTIIRHDDRLLFNSIVNPSRRSFTSYGWNKKNKVSFLKNIKEVVNKLPENVNTEPEEYKNEWSFFKIIKRLIMYPFCLFLFGFGLYMIVNHENIKSVFIGIGVVVISSLYLYSDLKIISKNLKSTSTS